ncbi:uncharacterized protein EI90DRAFT_3091092 [Cantharellus anzutake]|uniref:uncharacterized protein n=1 Tax=Cantharellus anzutake TaxID=1750568 RepID=UPI001907B3F6|nr:uncharacterized protein EI90DRAFT_3091092 [Cantharellus anzutake]KAF8313962.1 hypothetical protein EI90DRAFT_3091092 [Cantharellus anzutake]
MECGVIQTSNSDCPGATTPPMHICKTFPLYMPTILQHAQPTLHSPFMTVEDVLRPPLGSLSKHPSPSPPTFPTQKPARSPESMAIKNIVNASCEDPISPPTHAASFAMLSPVPDRSISPGAESSSSRHSAGDATATNSPPARLATTIPHKRSLSPPINVYQSRNSFDSEDLLEPPKKLWKHATGHRRGILVDDMTPLEAPTHYRRPPKSIARPETPLNSRKGPRSARDTGITADPRNSGAPPSQIASSMMHLDNRSPDSAQLNDDALSDGDIRGLSVESDGQKYLITTEEGNVISVADSPDARKRRQNTIAARRSRQRKLEYVRTLESQVADLEKERDDFKARCDKAEEKIQWLKEMLMDGRGAGRST